ncbi:DUF1310 family protein [Streptococcus zhangguiae]|uniref:DUF1310 family protein n=1 Tax=Streptococcus zhangguiae TaxID=2664091 RepID=A0A6I4RP81_9STRE|nr:DUF1310 family protein [Streptococcus sp. zg-70]MWV55935.1 DUF1310 family protein [Streptococcus sp. zg-70]
MKTWLKWVLGIVASLSVIIGIGVLNQMNKQEQLKQEMMEFVQSKEAREAIETALKNRDPQALTSEGIIQNYEIDKDTVKYNPMGAVMVKVYVNNDKRLRINCTLIKDSDGKIEVSGNSATYQLVELLRGSDE